MKTISGKWFVLLLSGILIAHLAYTNKHSEIEDVILFLRNRSPHIGQSYFHWPLLYKDGQVPNEALQFDPRVLPALWLWHIRQTPSDATNILLPFAWSKVVDLSLLNNSPKNCSSLGMELNILNFKNFCIDYPGSAPPNIFRPLEKSIAEQARTYISASQLYHRETPSQIILILEAANGSNLVTFPISASSRDSQVAMHGIQELEEAYISSNPTKSTISLKEELEELLKSLAFPSSDSVDKQLNLSTKDFEPRQLDRSSSSAKYFHEAHVSGTYEGGHYDWRFFKKLEYSTYERTAILHRMTRAWLRFSENANLKTWLAHGSLLSWYWNGMNFPWDNDVDMQMTLDSLINLAQNYNQSVVLDLCDDAELSSANTYLIDVNPNFRLDGGTFGYNNIDARFIDISSGMYVDITALVTTNMTDVEQRSEELELERLHKVVDPEYSQALKSASFVSDFADTYKQKLFVIEHDLSNEHKLLNCKDGHFVKLDEIAPLRKSYYEGVPALVPQSYELILTREYPRGLRLKFHRDWRFSLELGIWVPISKCGRMDPCNREDMTLESEMTESIRHKRANRADFKPAGGLSKFDWWIIQRNKLLLSKDRQADARAGFWRLFHLW